MNHYKRAKENYENLLRHFRRTKVFDPKKMNYYKNIFNKLRRENIKLRNLIHKYKHYLDRERIQIYSEYVKRKQKELNKDLSCIQIYTAQGGWAQNKKYFKGIASCKNSERQKVFAWVHTRDRAELACLQQPCKESCEQRHPNPIFC